MWESDFSRASTPLAVEGIRAHANHTGARRRPVRGSGSHAQREGDVSRVISEVRLTGRRAPGNRAGGRSTLASPPALEFQTCRWSDTVTPELNALCRRRRATAAARPLPTSQTFELAENRMPRRQNTG
jgi:hypothetical protein